jgi:hypothetical protein
VNPDLHAPFAEGVADAVAVAVADLGDEDAGIRMHCLDIFTAITKMSVTSATHPRILNKSGFAIYYSILFYDKFAYRVVHAVAVSL